MAINRVEALALGDLLGSLLGSVIEAQAQAARTTIDFIEDVGFETSNGKDVMRRVKLRYTKKDENNEPAEFEVEVPLLALVNVPSLSVSDAKLAFSYDVVTAKSTTVGKSSGPLVAAKPLKATKIKGFVRARPHLSQVKDTSAQPSRTTTSIDIDVTLAQQDLPIGIERLFDLAELGITEKPSDDV